MSEKPIEVMPLEKVLTRWVTPGLKAAGYKKQGKTYRKLDPDGNWAIVNFQGMGGTRSAAEERIFVVNIGVAVSAHLEFMDVVFGFHHAQQPGAGSGLWDERLFPPEDVEYQPGRFRDHRWLYTDDESAHRVGQHLERIIPRQALPVLTRLVDRRELIAEVGGRVAPRGLVTLLVDDGPSPALDAALEQAREADDQLVVEWALARLKART